MLTLEAVARSWGLTRLELDASETARSLLERIGYRTEQRRDIVRHDVELHHYAMRHELPSLPGHVSPNTATIEFMAAYVAAAGVSPTHQVVAFGDTPAMQDELADLALAGTKRATAGLLREFVANAPMPFVGAHVVLLDGSGTPRALWRTREVCIWPLAAKRQGFMFHDRLTTVFERFVIVWP